MLTNAKLLTNIFSMRNIALALIATSAMAYAKSGSYISGSIGLNKLSDVNGTAKSELDRVSFLYDASHKTGYRTGIAFGYNFDEYFALEFNTEYNANKIQNSTLRSDTSPSIAVDIFKGDSTNALLSFVNGYFFIPHGISALERLKPYVGAGVGYGYVVTKGNILSESTTSSGTILQGLIGAKYNINDRFDVFSDLRYASGKFGQIKYQSTSIRIGGALKF